MEILTAIGIGLGVIIQFGTIAGIVFALGKRDQLITQIKERQEEDRQKNSEQHKEFYESKNTVIEIAAEMKNILRDMEKINVKLDQVIDRLPAKGE